MAKCDKKQTLAITAPLSGKPIKRALPVLPPVPPSPPTQSINPDDPIEDGRKHDTEESAVSSNGERKQKKRRTRSLERLRDQSNDFELSDSDEDIAIAQKHPIIKSFDEPDAISATSPSMSDAFNELSNTTADEPAICADSPGLPIEANTFSDKSQLSYDEILKIEKSFEEDGANGFIKQSIVVDIHTEPMIELRIHESDSDSAIQVTKSMHSGILKVTKDQMKIDFEQERCFSEDDANDPDDDDKEKFERLVQSDSEVLSKTPLEFVVECDINENVIVKEAKPHEIIDLDHNHNDIVKLANGKLTELINANSQTNSETKLAQNRDSETIVQQTVQLRRDSVPSRSSISDSEGNEPVYATVDTTWNTVSFT